MVSGVDSQHEIYTAWGTIQVAVGTLHNAGPFESYVLVRVQGIFCDQ